MKISVVMAACNGQKYILDQIRSILAQISQDDELVISLDPSMDQTEDIIRKLDDPRIRLVYGPGKGVSKNFENALQAARGDLIFLSDQDDVWASEKVSKVKERFELCPETLLVIHDCIVTDEALNPEHVSYFSFHHSKQGIISNILRNSFIGCCMAFRRSLLNVALPFPESIPMHDQWLGIVASLKGGVDFFPEQLLLYRRHEHNQSSLTHAGLSRMIHWRLNLLSSLRKRGLL